MQVGERVALTLKDKVLEGVLMPSHKKEMVVLKLDSGYNLGVLKKSIKASKVLKAPKKLAAPKKKYVHSKKKKTITILHTGGTIASKVDYETGAVVGKFKPEDLIAMFPELEQLANIDSRLLGNMSSDDMRFAHYNVMAKVIQKEVKKGVDGIILTQGTDTIHYTGAALAFALENLPIPVVIVGAQRSSDRGSSDAATNLMAAARFILSTDCAEVVVCMHKGSDDDICWILPGTKCRKLHSSRRDAFQPVNASAYAEVNHKKGGVAILDNSFRKRHDQSLKLCLFKPELKVGLVKVHPSMYAEELKPYTTFDGLVVEGTGMGHMPITKIDNYTAEGPKILKAVAALAKKIPVVVSTQTVFGRVNMNVYSPGRVLLATGVLGNYSDMTSETSYIKLAWLLSNYPKKVKELFGENLRGELNPRIGTEFL